MEQKDLHDVIVDVLESTQQPLTVRAISEIIKEKRLWMRPSDNLFPPANQIGARINNYRHLFDRVDGIVTLKARMKKEKRLFRVTFNSNRWEKPSGHKWKKKDQGNNNVAFENQYGFGAEEWLFNPRYNIEGFQYGYLRGVDDIGMETEFVDEATLFTIHPISKDRMIIGTIKNLQLLDPDHPSAKVSKVYNGYQRTVIAELREVGADYESWKHSAFLPVVRFKMEDAALFDQPVVINSLKEGNRYNRFKPYIIDSGLGKLLSSGTAEASTSFIPGRRNIELGGFERDLQENTVNIQGLHNQISNDVERFLRPAYQVRKNNISIEKTKFGNNIADIVLRNEDDTYSIIEIKTSHNARLNIREALGQLLDYALWSNDLIIKSLVIVSPSNLTVPQRNQFKRIQQAVKLPLEYWQYDSGKRIKFVKLV